MFDNINHYHFEPTELLAVLDKNRQSIIHEITASRILIMATVAELTSSVDALKVSVDALIAKPTITGIPEADLDPVKAEIDTLNASVQAVLNPVAPSPADPAAPL